MPQLVAAYLRVERKPARAAINALIEHNVIEVVGQMGERGPYLLEPIYDDEEEDDE